MDKGNVTGSYFTAKDRENVDRLFTEGGLRLKYENNTNGVPFFTVITIAFNNCKELERSVNSILSQKFQDFEYIVIDGGSSDGTVQFLENFEDKLHYYISEPDSGIYDAINKGLSFSQGQYILLIHADDILKSDALWRAHSFLESNPTDILLGDSIYIKDDFPVAFKPGRHYGEETILRGIAGPHEGAFVSSATYDTIGSYDASMGIAADHKFLRNCILKNKSIRCLDRVVNYKEVGGDSFDKGKEFSENKALLNEIFSSLDDDLIQTLYCLKNYQTISREKVKELYTSINQRNLPGYFYNVLSKALLRVMMGDSPFEAEYGDNNNKAKKILKDDVSSDSVVLAIGKIKGISGGAERVLVELANYLNKVGHDVVVVCADGKAGNLFYLLDEGISFIDLNEAPIAGYLDSKGQSEYLHELEDIINKAPADMLRLATADLSVRQCSSSWENFIQRDLENRDFCVDDGRLLLKEQKKQWLKKYQTNINRWRNFIKLTKPKVLVPFMISCIPQVFLANRACGVPLVLSNHNNPSRDYYTQDAWNPLEIDKLMRLYSVSSSAKSLWLLDEYIDYMPPVCRKNAMTLANPISPAEHVNPYSNREKVLLAVGRFTEIKNFQLLLHVVHSASEELKDWELHIYGSGPEKENLIDLSKTLGIAKLVKILPPTTEINEVYNSASVFLSSSLVEGFPLTLCEAMSHGLPVIGRSSCSGVNSLIFNNENGLLIDDSNNEVSKYKLALLSLINDFDKRENMSRAAISSMRPYRPEIIYKKWLEALAS